MIAARTLLTATRRIIGAKGKLNQFLGIREKLDILEFGVELFLSWFAFPFFFPVSFLLGGGVGGASSAFKQIHFCADEHRSELHLVWEALGIQKQSLTAELNIAAGIQTADKGGFTIVARLYRVHQF